MARAIRALGALIVVGALVGGAAWLGDPLPRLLVLGSGGNPFAAPVSAVHRDFGLPESPLALSLRLEAEHAEVAPEALLALGDAISEEVGFWMLSTSGAADLDAAERWLWENDQIPELANQWAWALRQREVYVRPGQGRLSAGVGAEPPRYAERDEVILLLAHAAWALDLRADWVRSPVHEYLVLRSPDGAGVGVEATAFRHVTDRGARIVPDEPAEGLLLTFPPEVYPGPNSPIRNPDPAWPGSHAPISPEELPGALRARLADRQDLPPATVSAAFAASPSAPLAQALYRRSLAAGLAAWEAGDEAQVRAMAEVLAGLRASHGEWLRPLREEDVLAAVVAWADGRDGQARRLLADLFAVWEPDGAVMIPRSDAHAAAMWLDLEHGRATIDDWNRRLVPLMNRHQKVPEAMERLCGYARRIRPEPGEVEGIVPSCAR